MNMRRRCLQHFSRSFGTQVPNPGQNVKNLWSTYLASGRGTETLFNAIDVNKNNKLSVQEVQDFVDFVAPAPIRPGVSTQAVRKLDDLRNQAAQHEVSFEEFQSWLASLTQVGALETLVRDGEKASEKQYAFNKSSMSQALRRMQYAVRGEVVIRADQLKEKLDKGEPLPFTSMTYTNIGNPHAVGQHPITFFRQVLALCDLPAEVGVDHPEVGKIFPADAIARARELRAMIGPSGTGAYSHSQGLSGIRKEVAKFIEERDGYTTSPDDIFLANGASAAIGNVLTALIASDKDAIMIPIPQYPIYSALITLLGGRQVGYDLNDASGWDVSVPKLQEKLAEARSEGLKVRALVLINPGNPTGQVMSADVLADIAKFCAQEGICLLSDEVYQANVYAEGKTFVSTKKAALDAGVENMELVSFHSTSKGLLGECGRRGGYMELYGIDPYVHGELYKLASSGLCSGLDGQVMVSLMVRPPKPGDISYDQFAREEGAIFESLKQRAQDVVKALNEIDGISCNPTEGAMYAFPRVKMPAGAVRAAQKKGMAPDTMYALDLLEATGVVVVPASGFAMPEGWYGFRTTFLPPAEQLRTAVKAIGEHYKEFVKKYP